MPYLADESVDRPIVSALRQAGYNVAFVSERWCFPPGLDS